MTARPTRPWADWTHVLKVDPDRELVSDDTFDDLFGCGTDAILLGGTTGVTESKVERILEACAAAEVPVYQEPSNLDNVVDAPRVDGYLVPTVLNAGDPFWLVGAHKESMRRYPDHPWERTTTEAYIVLNPDATVATYTDADCDQTPADVAAYARTAEHLFGQEIVYLEYSGTLGDSAVLEAASDALEDATLFYGGGIGSYESARQMATLADVVVVGDLLHEEGVDAVERTVEGARDGQREND
ncbi:phosphoglycerol geranylgeranyltransferase [Natronobacterium gregoryi]|nr:putative phosphoglycerol geranylgeranyltransferase [Natronobacterium gregoryi]AFZ72492.1 phosphoglycerol geranylgeranyltransferase, putative [Natronobacterium gregoryi SP2]PLK21527.1 putative phosphoglycerol geranylgeranyltransferase [Natronobacterium gregoryi SP2]SFI77249.1 phosphoglycerol geranylgeranyltransferase [Natronobacterium gregoryi]